MQAIDKKSQVTLHFDIRLKDGTIADSTKNIGQPMTFSLGDERFSDVFEEALLGLCAGDKKKIMLLPEDAFGERHPANVFQVPKAKFSQLNDDAPLEVGTIVLFSQLDGRELPGLITAIEDQEITVDFNHPLAGQVVLFDVDIVEVK